MRTGDWLDEVAPRAGRTTASGPAQSLSFQSDFALAPSSRTLSFPAMLSLTALLHTRNDALRLGRCLETAYPCDEIVILDHDSTDATRHVAREFGARIVPVGSASDAASVSEGLRRVATEWVLCLDPRESLSEALAASLFEWRSSGLQSNPRPHAMFLREEKKHGWIENPAPQTRLVPASWDRWKGQFPVSPASPCLLEGKLLRFAFP